MGLAGPGRRRIVCRRVQVSPDWSPWSPRCQCLPTWLNDEPWTLIRVAGLVEQVGVALEALHRSSVVHGDVSPANVLFGREGRAYLADVGLAGPPADDGWGQVGVCMLSRVSISEVSLPKPAFVYDATPSGRSCVSL